VAFDFISFPTRSTAVIIERLKELLANGTSLADKISVQSDAGKLRVCELDWDDKTSSLSPEAKARFGALPVAWDGSERAKSIGRPIYLRRGGYFDAISRVFGGDFTLLPNTVFCGDILEMDLALPHARGANVHLVDRAAPFNTYQHESGPLKHTASVRKQATISVASCLGFNDRLNSSPECCICALGPKVCASLRFWGPLLSQGHRR